MPPRQVLGWYQGEKEFLILVSLIPPSHYPFLVWGQTVQFLSKNVMLTIPIGNYFSQCPIL